MECVKHDVDVCSDQCDKSACKPMEAARIGDHCGSGDGPPACVKECEPDEVCGPDCDHSACDAAEMAVIDGHCGAAAESTNETTIVEPLDNQLDVNVAHDIHDHVEDLEDCEDADCSPKVVENCRKLWENKLKDCAEHAEEWAHMCPAPTYKDTKGVQHNCKRGCCSEVAQEINHGDGGAELPPADQMWDYMSGGKEEITREELGAGFTVEMPPIMGPYIENFTDCMMMAYDVGGDGKVTKEEFMAGYGAHFEHCVKNSAPPEVLAKMADHGDHDEWEEDPKAEFEFIAGGDDVATVEDIASAISMDAPMLEPYAIDLANCIVKEVDTDESGDVTFDEFEASLDKDPFEPCAVVIPEDVLAEMMGEHHDEDWHWCHDKDPEEEPCCKLESHEEQDACWNEKMEEREHYCDFEDPVTEPCCAATDRADQEKCLEAKGIIFNQKKRTVPKKRLLLSKYVRASFTRYLRRFTKSSKKAVSSKKAGSSKKAPVKTVAKHGGKKSIKINPNLKNKISSDPRKLRRTAHSKK
jgi:hypothetical protein